MTEPSSNDGASQWKTISPYDTTTLDNPGLLITQVQLKGENYDEWVRSVHIALRARKKKLASSTRQLQNLQITQQTSRIGGLSILSWCLGYETALRLHCTQQSYMSRLHRTCGMIYEIDSQ